MRRKRKRKCKRGTILQSVLLSRKHFTPTSARFWLGQHGFKQELDLKPKTFRARQESPKRFVRGSFRTIPLRPNVKAVIGCPK